MAKKNEEKERVNFTDIAGVFNLLTKEEKAFEKSIIFALILMFSVILIPIGFLCGYMSDLIKNVLEGKQPFLPEWNFKDSKYMGQMYIRGWKLFVVTLPFLIVNVLFWWLLRNLFFFPVIISVITAFILPYLIVKYVETEDYASLLNFEEYFSFLKNNVLNIVVFLIISLGIFFAASLGVIFLIFVFFTLTWASFMAMYMFTELYNNKK